MQTVSPAWLQNQTEYFTSEGFVEITLGVGDPDAQADATVSVNGEEVFSDAANLANSVQKSPVKYGTLEMNIWPLDGTAELIPTSDYGQQGYIGTALSDGLGRFGFSGGTLAGIAIAGINKAGVQPTPVALPTITIQFSQVWTTILPGITIEWGDAYGEYATSFKVTAYNGASVVAEQTVTDNTSVLSSVELPIQNYDKIVIEVLEWCLPYRRARAKSLFVGITQVYTKSDIISYEHVIFVDPLAGELPKSAITFELKNLNNEFNPDNPQGYAQYLMQRESVKARYGYKLGNAVEWIDAGTFYLDDWTTPQNGITATFSARDALEWLTDPYTGALTGTLYDVAQRALQQAGMPTLLDGSDRWVIDASLSGISVPGSVTLDDGTTCAEVLQMCANAACCVFYQDRQGMLHIEPLPAGVTDYQIDRFNGYANAEIELSKQLKEVNVNNGAYVLSAGSVGEVQPINNPFISSAQAPTVAAWIAAYYTNRRKLSGDYRPDPRLDALDRITTENQFASSTVLVTQVRYTFNGAFRGSYEGRADV